MVILERIEQLMKERGLTKKKLAKISGLSDSTISNLFKRHNDPSFATLEAICEGLDITLMQFFADEGEAVVLTQEQKKLFAAWNILSAKQRKLMLEFVDTFQEEMDRTAKQEP